MFLWYVRCSLLPHILLKTVFYAHSLLDKFKFRILLQFHWNKMEQKPKHLKELNHKSRIQNIKTRKIFLFFFYFNCYICFNAVWMIVQILWCYNNSTRFLSFFLSLSLYPFTVCVDIMRKHRSFCWFFYRLFTFERNPTKFYFRYECVCVRWNQQLRCTTFCFAIIQIIRKSCRFCSSSSV